MSSSISTAVSSEISDGKFPEIYSNLSGDFWKIVNDLCQSAVSKSSIAKWCCKISMFLTNNSPDLYALTLCIMFRKKQLVYSTAPSNISQFKSLSNSSYVCVATEHAFTPALGWVKGKGNWVRGDVSRQQSSSSDRTMFVIVAVSRSRRLIRRFISVARPDIQHSRPASLTTGKLV